MKGGWRPELEPSIEEIMDYQLYMAILFVRFLWRARTQRGFPYSVWHMAGEGHVRSTSSSRTPQ